MPHSITLNAQVLTPKGYQSASNLKLNQEIIIYNPKTKVTATDYIKSILHCTETYPKLLNNFEQNNTTLLRCLSYNESIYVPAGTETEYCILQSENEVDRTIDFTSYNLGKTAAYMVNNLLYQDDDRKKLVFVDNDQMINSVCDADLTKINEVIFNNSSKAADLYSFYSGYIEHYEYIERPEYECCFGDYLFKKYKKEIKKLQEKRQLHEHELLSTCEMYSFKTSNHPDWGIIVDGFIVQQ